MGSPLCLECGSEFMRETLENKTQLIMWKCDDCLSIQSEDVKTSKCFSCGVTSVIDGECTECGARVEDPDLGREE